MKLDNSAGGLQTLTQHEHTGDGHDGRMPETGGRGHEPGRDGIAFGILSE
jgi:hypothetical protein